LSDINSVIALIHPTVSGISIPTNDTVWVVFDREIDEYSLESSFFLAGPDNDIWIGPDLNIYKDRVSIQDPDETLLSPGYTGFVPGTISIEKLNTSDYGRYSGYDYTGNGSSYRTKVIFAPTQRLSPDTEYTVYLSGDDDGSADTDSGICSRTVFDTLKGSNLGTGSATFYGGYNGVINDVFNVRVTVAGEPDSAEYLWWKSSDPLIVHGPLKAREKKVLLSDGVEIAFSTGTYSINDSFTVVVKTPSYFEGNLAWPFTTGSGNIQTLPDSTATTVTGTPIETSSTTTSELTVLSTTPADQDTNQTITEPFLITLNFSEDIDPLSITDDTFSIITEPVNGQDANNTITFSGVIPFEYEVDGDTITLSIDEDLLFTNNVVTVNIDSSIASTLGNTLAEDYEFYFTTTYSPLYSSVRKVRLEIGAFIQDIPDDTVNLAIFEASLEADLMIWNTGTSNANYLNFAKRQFVTCKAAEILLNNILGGSSTLKSKSLGDFSVAYDTSGSNINDIMDKINACLGKWLPVLQAAGYPTQEPAMFIKGELDPDRPAIGRGWDTTFGAEDVPAANIKVKYSNSRRYKRGYYSRWGR
jgi:hypothetical protein